MAAKAGFTVSPTTRYVLKTNFKHVTATTHRGPYRHMMLTTITTAANATTIYKALYVCYLGSFLLHQFAVVSFLSKLLLEFTNLVLSTKTPRD